MTVTSSPPGFGRKETIQENGQGVVKDTDEMFINICV